jgi:uncharacterized membrane protein
MFELIFGIIIGLTQFFNERILSSLRKVRIDLISFAAGLSSAYLFLLLLPEVYQGSLILKEYTYLILFIGFISIHISEKYIYKHVNKKKIKDEVRAVHHTTFFFYHFIIGIILVTFFKQSFREGLLFFIPVWFHTTISSAALTELHKKIKEKSITKVALSLSAILGMIIALLTMIPTAVYYALLALITGSLTYIIVKDLTPKGEEGNLNMFIFGVISYSLIIIITRLI